MKEILASLYCIMLFFSVFLLVYGEMYTLVEQAHVPARYVSVQAVVHRAEVDQNVLKWFADSCHSRGLNITWYVNPVNLNETITSLLKTYSSLGDDVELSFGPTFFNEIEPEERLEHVDSYVTAFRNVFGFDPALVEAYYIDAYTLSYIDSHYPSVKGSVGYVNHEVFCDNFKSAGAYYMPYYPSKYNALVPSNNSENKLDIVMFPFIHRDVTNCVMKESVNYNLDPQDGHTTVGNWSLYFRRLLYAFIDGWDKFGLALYLIDLAYPYVPMKVIEEDLDRIRDVVQLRKCSNVLDSEFVEWFRSKYEVSPNYKWVYRDPISEAFSSVWYFTPANRAGYVDGRLFEFSSFTNGYEKCFGNVVFPYDNSMHLSD